MATDIQKVAEHLERITVTLDFVAQLVMREPAGIQEEEANYQNVKSQLDAVVDAAGPKSSLAETMEKLQAKGKSGGIYGPTTIERIAGLKQRFDLLQTRIQELGMVADCQHFDWVERNAAEITRQSELRIQRETEQRQIETARLAKETAEREQKEMEDAAILEKIKQQEEEKKAKQRAKAKEKKKKMKEKQKLEEAERAAQQARLNELSKEERMAAEEEDSAEEVAEDSKPAEPETYAKDAVGKSCVTISMHELPRACYAMEYTQHAIEGSAKCVLVPCNQGDTAPRIVIWRSLVRLYNEEASKDIAFEHPAFEETEVEPAEEQGAGPEQDNSDEDLVIVEDEDEEEEAALVERPKPDVLELSRFLQQQWLLMNEEQERHVKIDRFQAPSKLGTWIIMLSHGGYFAAAVYNNGKPILHRSLHRYITRRGQGGRQSKADGNGIAKSMGSQLRRANEQKWILSIQKTLKDWDEHFRASKAIFLHAPGPVNMGVFFFEESPITKRDPRIVSVPFTTERPKFAEVQRVYAELTQVSILDGLIKHK